tara:strand:+ start:4780 stop:5052 length:273 start_codon:yes stop_codon:yes gene_type:complete
MSEEIKFTDKEVESLKELQKNYLKIQNEFGQITITRVNLKKQLEELDKIETEKQQEFENIQNNERDIVDELTKKYGQGTLDPSTGIFTKK